MNQRFLAQLFPKSCSNVSVSEDLLEDEATLWSLSKEYLEAARTLHNTPPTVVKYSGVVWYLLGHSIELSLKSYLYSNGEPIDSLKRMGHNLKRLLNKSRNLGLSHDIDLGPIKKLSAPYQRKRLEYRVKREEELPNTDTLIESVDILLSEVFSHVSKF